MNPVLPPDLDPDLTIVLIGKSGVGKSASGNTILGRPAFKSELDFKPVTMEISEQRGTVLGKQISVVDTPGALETKTTENIKKYCQDLLQSSRPCLFLVVIRVGRFTEEDQKAVSTAMEVLGPQGVEKSYLLFTGGDMLEGRTLEDFIFQDKFKGGEEGMLPDVVRKFAGKNHLFDNKDDDEEQVRELLLKSGHLTPQDQPDSPADDPKARRVVLIGLPGAGKSSSGNTILGSNQFKSGCDFDSVSAETVSGSATVGGRQVTVVDTPGITDPTGNQLYDGIMKTVVEASPGPHAFVVVVRLGRITETDIKLFELVPQLLSKNTKKYSMVLFTHGDELGGRSIDGLIRSNQHVSDLVSMCGGRFCVFENKAKRSREQVRDFLSKVDQIVSDNGGEHYTDDMFRMAHTFLKEEMLLNKHRNLSGDAGQPKRSAWERFKRFLGSHKWKFIALVAVVAVAVAVAAVAVGAVLLTGGAAAAAAGVATGVGAEAAGIVAAEGIVAAGTAVAAAGTGAGVAAGVAGTAVAAAGTGVAAGVAGTGVAAGVAGTAVAAAGTGAGVATGLAGTLVAGTAVAAGAGVAVAAAGAGTGAGVAVAAAGTGAGVAVAAAGTGAGVGVAAGAGAGAAVAAVIGAIGVAVQQKKEKVQ